MSKTTGRTTNRRSFVKLSATAGVGMAVGGLGAFAQVVKAPTTTAPPTVNRPIPYVVGTVRPVVPARPFNIVTLGDSIMWGQGLPEDWKFRNLVAGWLQSQLQGRPVFSVPTHSHSGARIYVDPSQDVETGLPGEIPCPWPSITKQVDLTLRDMLMLSLPPSPPIQPGDVDLVLLNGGLNDVGVTTVLDPLKGVGAIRDATNMNCVNRMNTLLSKVMASFPNATIVLLSYFPIVSNDTDSGQLGLLLSALGIVVTGNVVTGVIGGVALKDQVVNQSNEFDKDCGSGFDSLVSQQSSLRPQRTRQLHKVSSGIQSINAYAAPNSYLHLVGDLTSYEVAGVAGNPIQNQPSASGVVAYTRARACATLSSPPDPLCVDASMGHPNQAGAMAYASAITGTLYEYVPDWLGYRRMQVRVEPQPISGGHLVNVILYAIDSVTQQPVVGGYVQIGTQSYWTSTPFARTFACTTTAKAGSVTRKGGVTGGTCTTVVPENTAVVRAPGYVDVPIYLNVVDDGYCVRVGAKNVSCAQL
jgi:hypothetical protein